MVCNEILMFFLFNVDSGFWLCAVLTRRSYGCYSLWISHVYGESRLLTRFVFQGLSRASVICFITRLCNATDARTSLLILPY